MWLVSQQIYQMGIEQGEAKMQDQKDQEIQKIKADIADLSRQFKIFALDRTGKYSLDEIAARAGTTVDEVQRVLNEADAFVKSLDD